MSCFLCRCSRPRQQVISVPSHLRSAWSRACRVNFPEHSLVCDYHFNEHDFKLTTKRRRLHKNAVPTKLLPKNHPNAIREEQPEAINYEAQQDSEELRHKRRQILQLLSNHVQIFHKTLLISRRKCQQRAKRKQSLLRTFYMQQMLNMESAYVEMLTMPEMNFLESADADSEDSDEHIDELQEEFGTSDNSLEDNTNLVIQGEQQQLENEEQELLTEQPLSIFNKTILSNTQWLNKFRVSKRTFQWICAKLYKPFNAQSTYVPIKNQIPYEKRIGLSLYAFSTGDDLRLVAQEFGLSRPTVAKYVKRFAHVVSIVFSVLISPPKTDEQYEKIRHGLKQASNMPNCVGSLGVVHIPINTVTEQCILYKVVLQGVVDHQLRFRRIQIDDAYPSLYNNDSCDLEKIPSQVVNSSKIPCFVAAPSIRALPVRTWLMKSYENPQQPHEHDFNEAMDNLMLIKDCAFRRLHARWRILQRKTDSDLETTCNIIKACCILHNLLEERNEPYEEEWEKDVLILNLSENTAKGDEKDDDKALKMRDMLAKNISSMEM